MCLGVWLASKARYSLLKLVFIGLYVVSSSVLASDSISAGIWFNYSYQFKPDDHTNDEALGTLGDEAFILYADHKPEDEAWSFSAELRLGPGSFTDVENNSTGNNFALHKAWISYTFETDADLTLGKSSVPFAWETINFWPGDMLLGGYGDQMDVGVKFRSDISEALKYQFAYFHADDWGAESTDTLDDNGHWGSSTTYRKVQTLVADVQWNILEKHTLGLSAQAGRLQDLNGEAITNPDFQNVNGSHNALALYYIVNPLGGLTVKSQLVSINRELPNSLALENVKNIRGAAEVSYKYNEWLFYFDATWAKSNTTANKTGSVTAFAPGFSYDYGAGWFYVEYLQQDGFIDRNGDVGEGDFGALYASIDYYF